MPNQELREGRDVGQASRVYGWIFAVIYAVAVLPPVYIWMGQQHAFVFGLPISAWYTIATCALAIIICTVLYLHEYSGTETD